MPFLSALRLSRLVGFLGFAALLVGTGVWPLSLHAQSSPDASHYVRVGGGLSDYTGDSGGDRGIADFFDAQKFNEGPFPFVITAEAGFRFSSATSAGLGYQGGQYPRANASETALGTDRHTLYAWGRHHFGPPSWLVTPYLDAGLNLTMGGDAVGTGPSVGGGMTVTVAPRVSVYLESRLHVTFGDAAVDGVGPNGVPFDVLSALPATGVRIDI
ncbi:MAG: hypothetical protein ACLFTE_02270 [Salinivenus sp.]